MRALIVGYGKMGRAIEAVLVARGHAVVGKFGRREEGDFLEGNRAGGIGASPCDVAFEFTAPDAASGLVSLLLSKKIPVLSGTTGWDVGSAMRQAVEEGVPFLHSANFSIGVAAMRRGAAALAAALAPFREFHAGLVERHHSAKRDAPSGTAKALATDVAHASGRRDVPIVSLRQGGVPGEHTLYFEGEDETVELVHRARSRAIFAQGAVRAAEWMLASGRRGPLAFDDFFNDASRRGGAT
ncbi:MAG TPA: dihydrodipicolinate reductase C-terminal domain-containing protein [Thermoanaerobaculia bacterium]|jgi:4-hydroxy-tetrahydrodipicolinate reductase